MVSEQEATLAIDFVRDNAPIYAKAKAERVYIENFLKVVKAREMANSDKKTLGDREIDAYMSTEYESQLVAMRNAVYTEEKLKYQIEAEKLRFEHWKIELFNNRVEARAMS